MDLRGALKRQYHAALAMLRQAIEFCPPDAWGDDGYPNRTWHLAYHALFYAHLYLMPDEAAFEPWTHHRENLNFLGRLPWPPHDRPPLGEPYTQEELLAYGALVDALVDPTLDRVDLDASTCGFGWYDMPKLDHEMMGLRHLQHHAGQLADRVRNAGGGGVPWIGGSR